MQPLPVPSRDKCRGQQHLKTQTIMQTTSALKRTQAREKLIKGLFLIYNVIDNENVLDADDINAAIQGVCQLNKVTLDEGAINDLEKAEGFDNTEDFFMDRVAMEMDFPDFHQLCLICFDFSNIKY